MDETTTPAAPAPRFTAVEYDTETTDGYLEAVRHWDGTFTLTVAEDGGAAGTIDLHPQDLINLAAWITAQTF